MKSQREIIDEIKAIKNTENNYKEAFKQGDISEDALKNKITELNAIRCALNWVLNKS